MAKPEPPVQKQEKSGQQPCDARPSSTSWQIESQTDLSADSTVVREIKTRIAEHSMLGTVIWSTLMYTKI